MDTNAAPAQQTTPAAPAAGEPKPDMLDKLLMLIAKKAGRPEGKDRGVIEKAGDAIRKAVEKATGRKVPAKISN